MSRTEVEMDDRGSTLLARYPEVSRHLFTVDDYHRMGQAGILAEDDRVELIEGELLEMAPIGSEHAGCGRAHSSVCPRRRRAWHRVPPNPVRLDLHNEPQPDFAVLKPQPDGYRSALPTLEDVLLIVEVAASSLAYNSGLKLALYARHGIPEAWIVNLAGQEVEVLRKPAGDRYESTVHVDRSGSSLEIEALPGGRIAADRVFGGGSGGNIMSSALLAV
jgi:Uma2 family endonuclease